MRFPSTPLSQRFRGFLDGLGNALLARTLPTLREWLGAKLGPQARVDSMEIDGAQLRVAGGVLPLGPVALLVVDRASFRVSPEQLGRGLPPLRLESLEGSVVVPGEDPGSPRFVAPLRFESRGTPQPDEWVSGVATITAARWRVKAGPDAQAPLSGSIALRVTSSAWTLSEGKATAADATIALDASGRLDDAARGLERAALRVEDARLGHFIDALAALAALDIDVPLALPWAAKSRGSVRVEGDALQLEIAMTSGRGPGGGSPSLFKHASTARSSAFISRASSRGRCSRRPASQRVRVPSSRFTPTYSTAKAPRAS